MSGPDHSRPPYRMALGGTVALALGLGFGRFAFTPLLPIMQEDSGVTIQSGSWLAAGNYVGYLVGALVGVRWRLESPAAIRFGLLAVAITTLAMGLTGSYLAWLLLRSLAGAASAWILVATSAWTLSRLASAGYPALGAAVFAGVGVGITAAGLFVLWAMAVGLPSSGAWILMGLFVFAVTAASWNTLLRDAGTSGDPVPRQRAETPLSGSARMLIPCYGALGFGYIIPATFLPAAARQVVPDPLAFGWSWPIFGLAAALSTIAVGRLDRRWTDRDIWIGSYLVMAVGVALPALVAGLVPLLASAVTVGGTVIVATLVALREARALAGPQLVAGMTAAFATGQIIGPLVAGYLVDLRGSFAPALLAAAALLLASAAVLTFTARHSSAIAVITNGGQQHECT
jgi:predicted MFS family arabinose efflux permease